jgi:hypothetical protein
MTAPLLEKNEFVDVELLFCDVDGEVDAGTNVVTVWTTPPEVVVTTWGVDVDAGVGEVVDVLVEDDCEDDVALEDDVDEEEEDDTGVKLVEVECVESEEEDDDDDGDGVGVVWVGTAGEVGGGGVDMVT